jgi:hypothetical protein
MADMTRKMRNHPSLGAGEDLVEAVYGLGKGMLDRADGAAHGLGRGLGMFDPSAGYASEHERAVGGRDGFGFAEGMTGNGVLALTSERLLFFRKATVIGRPRSITVEVPIGRVVQAAFERPMVTVAFDDGSVCGLHVPRTQHPVAFVAAVCEGRSRR